ncbi:MAG: PspA/IM30 family protein, partial [Candidatus Nitrosocosmicus sp.]|nr:PspA/IM30 family protein [Candidatus Nitrosocosmicus sp.]
LIERFTTIFKAKASRIADKLENPHEMLNYSFEKQNELIIKLRQDILQVITSKKRLEMQRAKLLANVNTLEDQAKHSLISNREDLARLALERKNALMMQIKDLESQISGIEKDQAKLEDAERRLSTKIQQFKTRKEIIKAQYSAAEAQVKIKESITGISEEFNDVGNILDRVGEKTENMKAKAQALDEMIDSGTLTDFTSSYPSSKDADIERELSKISSNQAVEEDLKKMKNDLQVNPSDAGKNASTFKNTETKGNENVTIIRIAEGGQYEIDKNKLTQINNIDNEVVNILKNYISGQTSHEVVKKELKEKLEEITLFIKSNSRLVMDTDIFKSDLYIPNPDISVEEAQNIFKDEGLIK